LGAAASAPPPRHELQLEIGNRTALLGVERHDDASDVVLRAAVER
jgi:hypothetical protein